MCAGKGYVAPEVASAWFAEHPEARKVITTESPSDVDVDEDVEDVKETA
jgi:hypothetical protein